MVVCETPGAGAGAEQVASSGHGSSLPPSGANQSSLELGSANWNKLSPKSHECSSVSADQAIGGTPLASAGSSWKMELLQQSPEVLSMCSSPNLGRGGSEVPANSAISPLAKEPPPVFC